MTRSDPTRARPHASPLGPTRPLVTLLATLCAAPLTACGESPAPQPPSTGTPAAETAATPATEPATPLAFQRWSGSQSITLDGDVAEWPQDAAAVADGHWLYFRIKLAAQTRTLQAMSTPVALWIDADGDPSTGRRVDRPRVQGGLGADIEVVWSPRDPQAPRVGQGVMFRVYGPDGSARMVPHEALGFSFAPTHAAEWYEGRISRAAAKRLMDGGGLASEGRVAGVVVMRDGAGEVTGWADPFVVEAPPIEPWSGVDARVPAPPEGGVRVVSYNVEHTSPLANPEPFARLLAVLKPDVVLFQEWVEGDDADIASWLTAHAGHLGQWDVVKGEAWGVAVAARHPIEALTEPMIPSPTRPDRALRFVAARVGTPAGALVVGSAHLKCCGSKDSPEDRQRMAEAQAIASLLRELVHLGGQAEQDHHGPWALVVGGDLNLVGSRPPLETLIAGSDLDGSDLAVATAMVLGDAAMHTWYDEGNAFAPGRLDYLTYSDSSARSEAAFVLDTRILDQTARARLGVDAADSGASDHMPVVLDLAPRQ